MAEAEPTTHKGPTRHTDAALAKRGDRAAGLRLAKAVLPRARNLARCMVADDSEADDVAQVALTEFLRRIKKQPPDLEFGLWTDRSLAKGILAELKRPTDRKSPVPAFGTHEIVPANPPDGDRRYWDQRLAVRAVDALPSELRLPHALRHVIDMPVEEIAEALATVPENVLNATRSAHARLKAARAVAKSVSTKDRVAARVPDLEALSDLPGPARQRPENELTLMATTAWEIGMPVPAGKREVPKWIAVVVVLVVTAIGAGVVFQAREWLTDQPTDTSRRTGTRAKSRPAPTKPRPVVAQQPLPSEAAATADALVAAQAAALRDGGVVADPAKGVDAAVAPTPAPAPAPAPTPPVPAPTPATGTAPTEAVPPPAAPVPPAATPVAPTPPVAPAPK